MKKAKLLRESADENGNVKNSDIIKILDGEKYYIVHHRNSEDVISASVQSLVKRLKNFSPDEFDIIIT